MLVIRIIELNKMIADMVRGAGKLQSQRIVEPGFQSGPPRGLATDTNI